MKKLLTSIALIGSLCFTGCVTTDQPTTDNTGGAAIVTPAEKFRKDVLPYVKPAAYVASIAVLELSGNDKADQQAKANWMYSIAKAVRSLSGGQAPTADELEKTIGLFTPNKDHWRSLSVTIAGIYQNSVYKYVQGDSKLALDALEQLAEGVEQAAMAYVPLTPQ